MPTQSVSITIGELIALKRAKFPHRQSTDRVHRPCQLCTLSGAGYLCLRNENPSPAQFAAIEIMNGIQGSVERVDDGVEFDFALGGEGHELSQVVVAAHQVADEVDLVGDDVDGRHIEIATVAHDVV